MRTTAARLLLAIVLLFPAPSGTAPGRPRLGRETWYDALLKTLNGSHKNYGQWLEGRRKALLEASVRNPFFWYSLSMTLCASLLALALAKRIADSRVASREHARIESDIRNHDLHSRQKAREAIEKYNQHMEVCNRQLESSEPTGAAELQRVASQLDATAQERNKLQEELRQKSLIVADLSTRLDALSRKASGMGEGGAVPLPANGDSPALVDQVNRLQEQLYAERQKNRRLKGA